MLWCLFVLIGKELRETLGKLIARAVCQKSVSVEVWQACAHFHLKSTNSTDRVKVQVTIFDNDYHGVMYMVKGVFELQKAQRLRHSASGWDKKVGGVHSVVQVTLDYCKVTQLTSL